MVMFRPVREYLSDAMADRVEIKTLEEVRPSYAKGMKLTSEYQGYDKRNGWITWICLADGQAFGHSNGPIS